MISKRINSRKDGKSSAKAALSYGEGLTVDKETGEILDKSHRTRFGNFGIIDDGVYSGKSLDEMKEVIYLSSIEMQANCDLNTRVGVDKRIAHFVVSFNQDRPSEAVLIDTEDSMLSAMDLENNHFATFLHNDNGFWHLHIFVSRIEKDKLHRGNPLWQDRTKRDKVCREIEARHGLQRDNGMHEFNELGEVVEVSSAERRLRRESKPLDVTDKAKTAEVYSGEKSFQTWCNEMRIGDRLQHSKSWADLHAKAAAYGCEIKPKGAGFVICPLGQVGAIQLSKVGLKNLPARFGAFQSAQDVHQERPEQSYEPEPTLTKGKDHYARWKALKSALKPVGVDRMNTQREGHALSRKELREKHKADIAKINARTTGQDRFSAVSIAKMTHAIALENCKQKFAAERQALRVELAKASPGNTFRDYLVVQAAMGDNVALELARRYGEQHATDVLRKREEERLEIRAAMHGNAYLPVSRLDFSHQIERNGTVVYDLGQGRKIIDSAIAKQVQLNDAAANSPQAIATALTFATTKFGNTLTLTGSQEFQWRAVEIAVRNRLGIRFSDPTLEGLRMKLENEARATSRTSYAVDFSHLTPQQINQGVEYVLNQVPRPPEHVLRAQSHFRGHEAEGDSSVHELPGRHMDGDGQEADLPLPDTLQHGLGDGGTGQDQAVRRTGTGATRRGIDLNAGVGTPADGDRERASQAGERSRLPVIPSNKSAKRGIAVPEILASAEPHQVVPEATQTAAQWSAGQARPVVPPYLDGDASVAYVVLHVAPDGIVVDHGRAVATYPVPTGLVLQAGDRIAVGRKGELRLPHVPEQGVGKGIG